MNKKPRRLRVSIGGFTGPSYSVELLGGKLHYKSCRAGFGDWNTQEIQVSDECWEKFREALDSLDVWRWRKEYPNSGVRDGTQWDICIVYADRRLRSCGSNNYPERDDSESGSSEVTDAFDKFTKAVQILIGGRDFQ